MSGSVLQDPRTLAVPVEAQYHVKMHDKSIMGTKLTMKFWPTTTAASGYRPGDSIKFSLKNNRSVDFRTARLHFKASYDGATAADLQVRFPGTGLDNPKNAGVNPGEYGSLSRFDKGPTVETDGYPMFDDWMGSIISTMSIKFGSSALIEWFDGYNRLRNALAKLTIDSGYKRCQGAIEGYHEAEAVHGIPSQPRLEAYDAVHLAPNLRYLWFGSRNAVERHFDPREYMKATSNEVLVKQLHSVVNTTRELKWSIATASPQLLTLQIPFGAAATVDEVSDPWLPKTTDAVGASAHPGLLRRDWSKPANDDLRNRLIFHIPMQFPYGSYTLNKVDMTAPGSGARPADVEETKYRVAEYMGRFRLAAVQPTLSNSLDTKTPGTYEVNLEPIDADWPTIAANSPITISQVYTVESGVTVSVYLRKPQLTPAQLALASMFTQVEQYLYSDIHEGQRARTKHAYSIPIDLPGSWTLNQYIFLPSIVSMDFELTLEQARRCMAGLSDAKSGYVIEDVYLTMDTYDFNDAYLSILNEALMTTGIPLDFASYRIYKSSITVSSGQKNIYVPRRYSSLKSLLIFFEGGPLNRGHNLVKLPKRGTTKGIKSGDTTNQYDGGSADSWGDWTSLDRKARLIRDMSLMGSSALDVAPQIAAMLPLDSSVTTGDGALAGNDSAHSTGFEHQIYIDAASQIWSGRTKGMDFKNKTSYFPNPFVNSYFILVDGEPVTTHQIPTTYLDCTEAMHETMKSMRLHGNLDVETQFSPARYTCDSYIIGADFENSSLISGRSVSEIQIQLEIDQAVSSTGWANQSMIVWVVAHYDKRVIIQAGGKFTDIE